MAKNLPKLMTDAKPQIQYAQGIIREQIRKRDTKVYHIQSAKNMKF